MPPSYWFDPHHQGALRIISADKRIRGTDVGRDGRSRLWHARILSRQGRNILVDFSEKLTHRGHVRLRARYGPRQNTLEWEDGNVWHRLRSDPSSLFSSRRR